MHWQILTIAKLGLQNVAWPAVATDICSLLENILCILKKHVILKCLYAIYIFIAGRKGA